MLSSFGATQVEMASTAEDAMNKCKYDYYDIILCDFNLGAGKNGQQILEELRVTKRIKHTHLFIMITAETSKEVVLGAREYQPDAYIAKPITRTVLEQRLGQLLTQQKTLKPINKEIDLSNYSKAISLCTQMIESKSRYKSWCLQTLARLYALIGDNSSAEKVYRDVLNVRDVPWAQLGMGQVLNLEQQYHDAKTCFKEVILNNPNMIEAYDGMSESCLHLGQPKEAQAVLQEAVNLSPRLVLRQEKLGKICIKNNDLDGASSAFRHAVSYGENSIHEKPEHYLELGRCLSEQAKDNNTEEGKALAKEAITVLEKASIKFCDNEDASVSALLIESRVYKGQNQNDKAEDTLHKAECLLEESDLSAEVGIELAKTLYDLGQQERAEKLLVELSNRFHDIPDVHAKIEALMDEPEDLVTRLKAKELNKQAIQHVDAGDMVAAISSFESALELTPKHAALNLNFVQVLIKLYKNEPNAEHIRKANTALNRIQHIPEQHNQFKRLKHFMKLTLKLASDNAPEGVQHEQ
jgi:tetratricopeptide (TPR) repeat protein